MRLKRRRFESGGLGLRGGSGLVAGFARRFSPLQPVCFRVVHVFYAVAVRPPITTLASPKSV